MAHLTHEKLKNWFPFSLPTSQYDEIAPDQIENMFIIRSATHVGRDCCSDYKKIRPQKCESINNSLK